jgi:tRNA A-37 threonylcarbamoyl transferase component Bud32
VAEARGGHTEPLVSEPPSVTAWDFAHLPEGLVLGGRYRLGERVAVGASSAVYRAHDVDHDFVVALKVMDPLKGADPIARARFEREIAVLARINHPGVCRAIRAERFEGMDALVLEYLPGETLAQHIARGPLAEAEALEIARAVATTLEVCHRQSVLHRDLKPANILLHPERGPVVLDFGSAWFSAALNLTRTGAVVGSPAYLAPEAFASATVDERADVYALGVVLYELLVGRPLIAAETVAEVAVAHLRRDTLALDALDGVAAPWLREVVARAVERDPAARFATARELRLALEGKASRALRLPWAHTDCATCGSRLVVNVPLCPGCGVEVDWHLQAGGYLIQLRRITEIEPVAAWIEGRYHAAAGQGGRALRERLERLPVTLAAGISARSAERLAAEAEALGCSVVTFRAGRLQSQVLTAPASNREVVLAGLAHLGATLILGAAALQMLPPDFGWLGFSMPLLAGAAGVPVAALFARRPILSLPGRRRPPPPARATELAPRLAALRTSRARALASAAVYRASPVLSGEPVGVTEELDQAVGAELDRAIQAAEVADAQALVLQRSSRARLAQALDAATTRAEQGDDEANELLTALRRERDALEEASLAFDLAAREALAASERITVLLATRTEWREVDPTGEGDWGERLRRAP